MKNARKILFVLLSLSLIFTMFACGCKHADEDNNGICDLCEEKIEPKTDDVALISEGVANFQFVLENGVSSDIIKDIDSLIKTLSKDYDIELARVTDKADNIMDVEVLVGDITTRGEKYKVDKYALGKEGYVIKIVDSKIVINAGSPAQLAEAVEIFIDDILGMAEEPDELWDVVMTAAQMVEVVQSDYRITGLTVNGADMKGYTIAVDTTNEQYKKEATSLQTLFYERAGYWFNIVDLSKADKSIIIKHVEVSDDIPKGFKVYVNDSAQIVIECAYDNMLTEGINKFTGSNITLATGAVDFTGTIVDDYDITVLTYEMFGAKGDGKTNDYEAIYRTHVAANEGGQSVRATAGKTYYIESPVVDGKARSIPVMTNTDWQNAKFIIDDRKISPANATTKSWNIALFDIKQNEEPVTISNQTAEGKAYLDKILAAGLNPNTTKIDLGDDFRCDVMLMTANSTHKVYRRRGYGAYAGVTMEEVVILDKDGNVRSDTSIMYNYIDLTGLEIIKLGEVEPITVQNGEFTTMVSEFNCIFIRDDGRRDDYSPYISRGLHITRSYTTVKNVKHYVEGEKQWKDYVNKNDLSIEFVGSTYRGFYITQRCNDVTIEDCILTGRRCYRRPHGGTGGTYDLSAFLTNNLIFKNCVQSNFWSTVDPDTHEIKAAKEGDPGAIPSMESFPTKVKVDSGNTIGGGSPTSAQMHWGIGGTNLCKNTKYHGSTLSRYDAHEGTYGGEIVDSTICAAALTGGGDFLIENTKTYTTGGRRAFSVRSDYGYTWAGTVHLKNVHAIIHAKADNDPTKYSGDICVVAPSYKNWYWGYQPTMPSIIIEDLYYYDVDDYDTATQTYAPIPTEVPIYLWGRNIKPECRNHLDKIKDIPYYSVEDKDKDGYIDIPDVDGDGDWGNTPWKFDEVKEFLGRDGYDDGFTVEKIKGLYGEDNIDDKYLADGNGLYDNFSIVNPPKFVKIISNKGGYKYYVAYTAESGLSNGLFYGFEDNNRGFYGCTTFYYGPGENDCYKGQPKESERDPNENVFVFYTKEPAAVSAE